MMTMMKMKRMKKNKHIKIKDSNNKTKIKQMDEMAGKKKRAQIDHQLWCNIQLCVQRMRLTERQSIQ
jgi:hypothetical protein